MVDSLWCVAEPMKGIFLLAPDVHIDFDKCSIVLNEKEIVLTAREVAVLTVLVSAPNRYYSPSLLAAKVTKEGADYAVSDHSIKQTISVLRRKLGEDGKKQRFLIARRGIGYGLFTRHES